MINLSAIHGAKILIVDDHEANIKLLEFMLRNVGYWSIFSTMDSRNVVEMHRANRYDLIVLDVNMPNMNGLEVLEGLKSIETEGYVPVLVVTADPKYKLQALESGAKDFITKPFDQVEVLTRIHNILEVRMLYTARKDFDVLTGLPNRALFQTSLVRMLGQAKESHVRLAVFFIDLDRFKNIADSLGHLVSDELLRQVSLRLANCIGVRDIASRLGGDEFALAIVLPDRLERATVLAAEIREALRAPFVVDEHEVITTASIGITIFPDDATDADTLLKYADTAMFQAKAAGRDTFRMFTSEMDERARRRMELEHALRKALDNHEFVLVYQPKLDTNSGRVVGVEALLRWYREGNAPVSPSEFVPILEELGMIVPVGNWIIETVCEQISEWDALGIAPFSVAVNVSSRQFVDDAIEMAVVNAIKRYAIDPSRLEIEITETSLMENVEATIRTLEKFKSMGIRLSIDDFGTGYSSLAYLRRFPISTLKIDIAFIREVTSNPDDAAITMAIIRMAHSLRMNVVAEGVETVGQLSYLIRKGCDQIQGYYFSRPIPAKELQQLIQDGRKLALPDSASIAYQRTLLIVHHDLEEITRIRRALEQDGHLTYFASSTAKAFDILAASNVQVVLCDQHLTEMSGIQFIEKAQHIYPDSFKILLLSKEEVGASLEEINRSSIYRFFTSSVDYDTLRQNIKTAFQHYWGIRGMLPDDGAFDGNGQASNLAQVNGQSEESRIQVQEQRAVRILVVDDDRLILAILRKGLRRAGYDVVEAESGEQALDLIKEMPIDLVMLDVEMAGMSGLDVAKHLNKKTDIPFLFLTKHDEAEIQAQAIRSGAVGYLQKPINFEELLMAVRVGLARAREILELRKNERELSQSLVRIKDMMVQNDKMASIGQLAAGVAHEINNPIGYVHSNIGAMNKYIAELFEVLDQHGALHQRSDVPSAIKAELEKVSKSHDIEFLREDMLTLIRESKEGITRVRKIVQDLKDFSHVSTNDDWQWVDLHKGLESTINIISNEIKYRVSITKEFGEFCELECCPGPLNQVFMNLLVNASHAIPDGRRGEIVIRTSQTEEQVVIDVSDNGSGIPPDIMDRIFDPFFTTKPVGKGTGLGLALSHSIIQKHNGTINVESELGTGTRFRVTLPKRRAENQAK